MNDFCIFAAGIKWKLLNECLVMIEECLREFLGGLVVRKSDSELSGMHERGKEKGPQKFFPCGMWPFLFIVESRGHAVRKPLHSSDSLFFG